MTRKLPPVTLPDADWSPGRVAVLISDVRRWQYVDVQATGLALMPVVRPFDGPVAELSEVLA